MIWYRAAAEGGDFRGQYNLATILTGHGHTDEAERRYRATIGGGSPDFLLVAGKVLSAASDPELRKPGRIALERYVSIAEPAVPRCQALAQPRTGNDGSDPQGCRRVRVRVRADQAGIAADIRPSPIALICNATYLE
jgi:hypothetical protein